jgi:hypothetical protein
MDYTTLEDVKAEIHAPDTVTIDDTLLGKVITAASRAIDKKCTGVVTPDADNYFESATITGERLVGRYNIGGMIRVYPKKPLVTALASFAYRKNLLEPWVTVDPARLEADGGEVHAYPEETRLAGQAVQVELSYTGGLADATADLPADLQEIAVILSIRYYREAETGLTDSMGIAELGTLIYTKAWPTRALDMIQPYVRQVAWSKRL